MAKQKSELKMLCEDYCKQYKRMKGLTLAKKIKKENPEICARQTVENIRKSYVNTIRGLNGGYTRNAMADKSLYQNKNHDTRNSPKVFKEEINTSAKVLILDIETAPLVAYTWGIWNQNIQPSNISTDWYCLTWAAKWLFEDKVYSAKLTGAESLRQDDSRIIKGIWELLNKADIVIAHNGQKFDIPKLNSRFIINKLHPPLPYQQIDTLLHIRRQFGFTSNKLDYVNQLLNLPRKKENEGMPLWIKCYKGDNKALKEMLDYNIEDVKILEETYLRIRAWIKPHPNMGLFILDEKENRCPTCGSSHLEEMGKEYKTTANSYVMFRCDNCGSTGRKRVTETTIKQKRHLLMSIPK
jgi:DNA polymerase elongation subunit (family B)